MIGIGIISVLVEVKKIITRPFHIYPFFILQPYYYYSNNEITFYLIGNGEKVKALDMLVTKMAGFDKYYSVTGQTYSRKVDVECMNALSSLGSTVHKVS